MSTGMLIFLLLTSAALTAPVSVILLWRYRRSVIRAMAGRATAAVAEDSGPSTGGVEPAMPLHVESVKAASLAVQDTAALRHVRHGLRIATTTYAAAGLAYAAVMTSAWMVFTREHGGFPLTRFVVLLLSYAWPIVLAVCIIAAVSARQRLTAAGVYFGLYALAAIWSLARNPDLTVGQVVTFWLIANGPATLLLLAFLHRRVRAVGPLVLAFMVVAVTGAQALLSLVDSSQTAMRIAVDVGGAFGFDGHETFFAVILAGFAVFGVAGWWLLKWLGHRYQSRRMSDQSLTLDSMWLFFAIEQSISFAFEGWAWVLTGIAGFIAYKLIAAAGFAILGTRRAADGEPTLLLLRVFALGRRSERLFHAFSKLWLRLGSISMIAGPDLVATTVEPHEFLQFMGGELSRGFVAGAADLDHRVRSAARGFDPDGRYRVNEYFCYADTWQMTMKRLATQADAVLMDLRSFSATNKGCLFEIGQLLDGVDLRNTVLLVDETTDHAFLDGSLRALWSRISADSPNRRLSAARIRVVDVSGAGGAHQVQVLLNVLLGERETSGENLRNAPVALEPEEPGLRATVRRRT